MTNRDNDKYLHHYLFDRYIADQLHGLDAESRFIAAVNAVDELYARAFIPRAEVPIRISEPGDEAITAKFKVITHSDVRVNYEPPKPVLAVTLESCGVSTVVGCLYVNRRDSQILFARHWSQRNFDATISKKAFTDPMTLEIDDPDAKAAIIAVQKAFEASREKVES